MTEHDFAEGLARRRPPTGFAGRVMENIQRERIAQRGRKRRWLGMAAAVFFLLLWAAVVVEQTRLRRERELGEQARREVLLALRIASDKVNLAADGVRKSLRPAPAGSQKTTERKDS
ncbi:MAG TPA: hypothetical protein VM534_09565 [Thermoanaerobaculia bacterium]|nr:hypothetical protein [Thermoanaerobaculia bacterium]